jgi:hypothetical protein
MKPYLRLSLILAACAATFGARLTAQNAAPARSAGHVLLLENDRGLEGDIAKVGDQYRIRRGASEVWLTGEKVVRLCADWEDAYAFMKTRANLADPDERLRLAKWCQLNNLRATALVEAKAALEMRPKHEASRQLVAVLTRALASLPAPAKNVVQTAHVPSTPAAGDISADSYGLFATRVQPILMNTCVKCHSGGRGGSFQLQRTDGSQRNFTQANLAATLLQVRTDNPALSPLLIKAVSRHGEAAQSPLKDRQTVPFKTLQAWIDNLLVNNPHLLHQAEPPATTKVQEPVAFAQASPAARKFVPQPAPAKKSTPPAKLPPLPDAAPLRQGTDALDPVDAFDPLVFNRQNHPGK